MGCGLEVGGEEGEQEGRREGGREGFHSNSCRTPGVTHYSFKEELGEGE